MSKLRLAVVGGVIGLAIAAARAADPAPPRAETTNLDILLDTIRANRKALIAVNLQLSAEEAAKFWPLYDRYQQEISANGDRLVALVQDYTTNFRELPNDKAFKIVEDYLTIDADRVRVRRAYLDEFAKVLPGRTVARFYQIENKMDAVVRYELAASIPVIDPEASAPAK